jgi:hypothetical protein
LGYRDIVGIVSGRMEKWRCSIIFQFRQSLDGSKGVLLARGTILVLQYALNGGSFVYDHGWNNRIGNDKAFI